MAFLPELDQFDQVYQLETTDPVLGSASGVSNTPQKHLTNRSRYLKNALERATIYGGDILPANLAVGPGEALDFDNINTGFCHDFDNTSGTSIASIKETFVGNRKKLINTSSHAVEFRIDQGSGAGFKEVMVPYDNEGLELYKAGRLTLRAGEGDWVMLEETDTAWLIIDCSLWRFRPAEIFTVSDLTFGSVGAGTSWNVTTAGAASNEVYIKTQDDSYQIVINISDTAEILVVGAPTALTIDFGVDLKILSTAGVNYPPSFPFICDINGTTGMVIGTIDESGSTTKISFAIMGGGAFAPGFATIQGGFVIPRLLHVA